MTSLKTDEALLQALRDAAMQPQSPEQIFKQRISFIMGSLGDTSAVTRREVTDLLAEQEGRKLAS